MFLFFATLMQQILVSKLIRRREIIMIHYISSSFIFQDYILEKLHQT